MERRSARRYNIPLRALLYYSKGPPQTLSIQNISASGVLCRINRSMPEGTEVFISLFMKGAPNKQSQDRDVVRVKGRVKRRSDSGLAVSFDQLYQFAWM